MWLIDHGVCFHIEPKLRTVIWDFAGLALSGDEMTQLTTLREALAPTGERNQELGAYLSQQEINALSGRIGQLLEEGVYPYPSEEWPSTPWPPV